MSTTAIPTSAEDLWLIPNHGLRMELVKGELRTMAPSGGEHGTVTYRLTLRLGNFIEQHALGEGFGAETGFMLSRNPDTVRAPDFAFIPKARVLAEGITRRFVTIVPDLVVEVLSPSDSALEIEEKIDDWIGFGVRQVWVVSPKMKTITVWTASGPRILHEHDAIPCDEIFPGSKLTVKDILR